MFGTDAPRMFSHLTLLEKHILTITPRANLRVAWFSMPKYPVHLSTHTLDFTTCCNCSSTVGLSYLGNDDLFTSMSSALSSLDLHHFPSPNCAFHFPISENGVAVYLAAQTALFPTRPTTSYMVSWYLCYIPLNSFFLRDGDSFPKKQTKKTPELTKSFYYLKPLRHLLPLG